VYAITFARAMATRHFLLEVLFFVLCTALVLMIGGLSGSLTFEAVNGWYNTLNKPNWNPPNSLFGPVWVCLYFLMGIGLYLVIRSKSSFHRQHAIALFCAQLALNFMWSLIFFRWQMLGVALAEILTLLCTMLLMYIAFKKVHLGAALLQIPYILWVSFATILNATLWWIN
jgi:translocator protein